MGEKVGKVRVIISLRVIVDFEIPFAGSDSICETRYLTLFLPGREPIKTDNDVDQG